MKRCAWCGEDPVYQEYHDHEWGVPERDGRALWEKLILDGFQAGLSWITILRKRENFRNAFAGFDPEVIARWGEDDITRLLGDPGIIRHRGKIAATITNAQAYLDLGGDEAFAEMIWAYVDGRPLVGHYTSHSEVPTASALSTQISKDLKKAGFKFCGPTIVYAWMEACGLFMNHTTDCHRYPDLRGDDKRPAPPSADV